MAVLSSVIPGVREIRGPLFAGYLWLLFLWLLVDPAAPTTGKGGLYDRLSEASQAIGPIGLAIAASVTAYLLGSLMTAAAGQVARLAKQRFKEASYDDSPAMWGAKGPPADGTYVGVARIRTLTGLDSPWQVDAPGDFSLMLATDGLVRSELEGEFQNLESAIEDAERQSQTQGWEYGEPDFEIKYRRAEAFAVLFTTSEFSAERKVMLIPQFSVSRDLFSQIPLIRTRLAEVAEATGAKVERVYFEADFRFSIAVPLAFLIGLFATSSPLWLFGLVLPAALLIQGWDLQREGDRQLVDALRARSGTQELEQVYPGFARFRSQAHALAEALRSTNWQRTSSGDQ